MDLGLDDRDDTLVVVMVPVALGAAMDLGLDDRDDTERALTTAP